MKKIKGKIEIADLKRCYVEVKFEMNCPKCNNKLIFDFGDNYLMYPEIGKMDEQSSFCRKCDKGYLMPIKVTKAEVEIACYPKKIKAE